MTAFNCHVIYTIPLSLAYSHHEEDIQKSYGGHLPMVPATKIIERPPSSELDTAGVLLFKEMVAKRVNAAGAEMKDVFENDNIITSLIALTGGQPTELMTLVREAIILRGLPIGSEALARAEKEGQREYARMLRSEHWPIIEQVRRHGTFQRDKNNEEAARQALNSRAILQYVNDEEWYALNPLVESLKQPDTATSG